MKNLIAIFALGTILFSSCAKKDASNEKITVHEHGNRSVNMHRTTTAPGIDTVATERMIASYYYSVNDSNDAATPASPTEISIDLAEIRELLDENGDATRLKISIIHTDDWATNSFGTVNPSKTGFIAFFTDDAGHPVGQQPTSSTPNPCNWCPSPCCLYHSGSCFYLKKMEKGDWSKLPHA